MYDAYISMIIDPNACLYDAPMHDAYIYDPPSLTLMHESMMRYFLVTDGPTDEQGDSRSRIHDPDTCVYDAFINVPRSLTLMHVCMMRISMILDLDSEACMYV